MTTRRPPFDVRPPRCLPANTNGCCRKTPPSRTSATTHDSSRSRDWLEGTPRHPRRPDQRSPWRIIASSQGRRCRRTACSTFRNELPFESEHVAISVPTPRPVIVEIDPGNLGRRDRSEFVRRRFTVVVGVDPDEQLLPDRIARVNHAVAVAVVLLQRLKAVLGARSIAK